MRYIKTFESFNTDDKVDLKQVGEKVEKEIKKELTPEEAKILADFYKEEGKEKMLDIVQKSVGIKEGFLTSDKKIPEEGEFGMSKKEIQVRSILDRLINKGTFLSTVAAIPAAIFAGPAVVAGLGAAALAGFFFQDAAWWNKQGEVIDGVQRKYGSRDEPILGGE